MHTARETLCLCYAPKAVTLQREVGTLRRDHRPYWLKQADLRIQKFYLNRFLAPRFDALGKGATFIKPWHVDVFGGPIKLGRYVNVIACADAKVRFTVWPERKGKGRILIGDYALICPGVRMGSAADIVIGPGTMIASHAYLTDSDWHGIYNRLSPGNAAPIRIEENVWIGDRATICKGVHIGKNSIIGTGSVVTGDIPAHVIAAGNPATVVKRLDPEKPVIGRSEWFRDPEKLTADIDLFDRALLKENTFLHWLRHLVAPRKGE